jgi:hypothetical protein
MLAEFGGKDERQENGFDPTLWLTIYLNTPKYCGSFLDTWRRS